MTDRLSIALHYAKARRNFTRWKSRERLEAWQEREVRKHLRRVLPTSDFFRNLFAGRDLKKWREVAVTTKAELMGAFDAWNTAGITLAEASALAEASERSRDFSPTIRGFTVGLSSGTSGSRGVFLASPAERQCWAGTLLARALQGTLRRRHRAALFLRADSPLYQTVGSRRFSFSFFDLFSPFEEHWPRLQTMRPTILAAPPSALVRLAVLPDAHELLAPPGILLSVADVLDEADRVVIEHGFGCRVGQLYQATEGFLAATCPEGRLHWNEDTVVVEKQWIDEARTRYHPIITDFRRTTQPILRFRLDDVIVAGDGTACPCGSVFETLEKIEGRQDDVFYVMPLDGGKPVMMFPDFVRRALILALPPGVEYTVTQTALESWKIEMADQTSRPSVIKEIEALCKDLQVCLPSLVFSPWTPPHSGEKRRRVRRAFAAP
jgi:putative adenylate-forming enzyme